MSQRWLDFLEKIGTGGTVPASPVQSPLDALNPDQSDWIEFWDFDVLYHLYGPAPESAWYPFHCPTFFAGIQNRGLTPRRIQRSPVVELMYNQNDSLAPYFQWIDTSTITVIDVPGGEAVQIAVALQQLRDVQLISTFDHWSLLDEEDVVTTPGGVLHRPDHHPELGEDDDYVVADPTVEATEYPSDERTLNPHLYEEEDEEEWTGHTERYTTVVPGYIEETPPGEEGLPPADLRAWPPADIRTDVAVDSRDVLDAMATAAPEVLRRRQQLQAAGKLESAAPVWICDSRRLVPREMEAGEYDNRYFIDPALLPTADMLQRHGITKAVYWRSQEGDSYLEDLAWWFAELEGAGITILRVDLNNPQTWAAPRSPVLPPGGVKYEGPSFYQSKSGGFGAYLPDPEDGDTERLGDSFRFGIGRRRLTSHSG